MNVDSEHDDLLFIKKNLRLTAKIDNIRHMTNDFLGKKLHSLKKQLPLLVFLLLSIIILLLASTFFFKGSCVDILLILIIWCLPLFIH